MSSIVEWLYSVSPSFAPWLLFALLVLIWFGPEFWNSHKTRSRSMFLTNLFILVLFFTVLFVLILEELGNWRFVIIPIAVGLLVKIWVSSRGESTPKSNDG